MQYRDQAETDVMILAEKMREDELYKEIFLKISNIATGKLPVISAMIDIINADGVLKEETK